MTDAYGSEAEDYRDLWAPVLHPIALELVAELPPAPRVLDLATGAGTLLPALRERLGAELVLGVDVTPEMIALADPSFGRVVGDITVLPVMEEAFDVAVLAFVLFHLPRPAEALAEAHRALRPGGTVGTVTWTPQPSHAAFEAWTEELDRYGAAPEKIDDWHHLVDAPDKVEALLSEAGFSGVRAWTLSWRDEPTVEGYVDRRLRLGTHRRRLESLDATTRAACIAAAADRIRDMGSDAVGADRRFVLATAIR